MSELEILIKIETFVGGNAALLADFAKQYVEQEISAQKNLPIKQRNDSWLDVNLKRKDWEECRKIYKPSFAAAILWRIWTDLYAKQSLKKRRFRRAPPRIEFEMVKVKIEGQKKSIINTAEMILYNAFRWRNLIDCEEWLETCFENLTPLFEPTGTPIRGCQHGSVGHDWNLIASNGFKYLKEAKANDRLVSEREMIKKLGVPRSSFKRWVEKVEAKEEGCDETFYLAFVQKFKEQQPKRISKDSKDGPNKTEREKEGRIYDNDMSIRNGPMF